MKDHLREAKIGNDSKVYRAIRKYNTTKADFEIIESNIKTQEEANLREIYWISFYDSYNNGYNSTKGGDVGNGGALKGEKGPKAIFSNEEVLQIRLLKSEMKYSKREVYDLYKDRVSAGAFHKIWNYDTYTEIGTELNTKEVIDFYKYHKPESKNTKGMFTEQDIINIRNLYFVDVVSSKEIAEIYNCNSTTISKIVANKTYTNIPMPIPSLQYKRKNHVFEKEEIDNLIDDFIKSKLNIKDFWKILREDNSNIFGGYVESSFRSFLYKELENRNYKYIAYSKNDFEITKLD